MGQGWGYGEGQPQPTQPPRRPFPFAYGLRQPMTKEPTLRLLRRASLHAKMFVCCKTKPQKKKEKKGKPGG